MGGGYDELIVESILNLFSSALKLIFGWISLPELPAEISSVVNQLIEYMKSGMCFVFLFFSIDLIRIMLPLVIVVANFDKVYKLVMFVLRKIFFFGIM